MAHRRRLGTLQEHGGRKGFDMRMSSSASSLLGQWQGRVVQAVSHWQGSSAQQLSAGPLPPTGAWHTWLSSQFPSHGLPIIILLFVTLGAEDLRDKSGLDLPCSHWD